MYKLQIEHNGEIVMEETFKTFQDLDAFVNENWDNDTHYWVSCDDQPAMEICDIYDIMF